jgi:hypothetical protein
MGIALAFIISSAVTHFLLDHPLMLLPRTIQRFRFPALERFDLERINLQAIHSDQRIVLLRDAREKSSRKISVFAQAGHKLRQTVALVRRNEDFRIARRRGMAVG